MQEGVDEEADILMSTETKDAKATASDVGSDPYLEVPRIVYEPDDDEADVGPTDSAAEMELDDEAEVDFAPLAVPA